MTFTNKNMDRIYIYNLVFGLDTTQEDILYKLLYKQTYRYSVRDNNAIILAYGQTGSGKTYIIMGIDDSINKKIYQIINILK